MFSWLWRFKKDDENHLCNFSCNIFYSRFTLSPQTSSRSMKVDYWKCWKMQRNLDCHEKEGNMVNHSTTMDTTMDTTTTNQQHKPRRSAFWIHRRMEIITNKDMVKVITTTTVNIRTNKIQTTIKMLLNIIQPHLAFLSTCCPQRPQQLLLRFRWTFFRDQLPSRQNHFHSTFSFPQPRHLFLLIFWVEMRWMRRKLPHKFIRVKEIKSNWCNKLLLMSLWAFKSFSKAFCLIFA